jgi:subtilisin family serine protease
MQPALPWTAPLSVPDSNPAGLSLADEVAPVAVLDSGWREDPAYANVVVAAYDALAPDTPIDDAVGHGTQMALIASGQIRPSGAEGQTKNTGVPVVAVRIFDESGYTASSVLMRGIDFALKAGARVISLSWGAAAPSTFIEQAVHMARDRGAVVVAAVGNDNTGQPVYPAAFEGVVGVGALNPDGTVWPRSNQGDFVALLAPGFASLPVGSQGEPPGAYAGTSIAAAYTAGRLALEMSRNPAAFKSSK